ncbi:MAG: MFS transporter [Chloroflexi bacterium]|nr:MFS transporter [Chloroflexota bacterium]
MSHPTAPSPAPPDTLRTQLPILTGARTISNTVHRMVYPFLPRMARGLGVDLEAITLAITARSALGLGGPLFGALADTRGRKAALLTALLILAAAMLLVTVWPTYPALFIALLLAVCAKLIYDPAVLAYIGDRVHYTRRGFAIALNELSWSAAFLIGMPLLGWLIARTGRWYAPFPVLGGLALLSAVLVWRVLPGNDTQDIERPSLIQGARIVLRHRPAVAGLLMGTLISLGNETIFIVYGAWMEDSFGLKVAALGAASVVIGVAELAGEGLVAGLVDRLGKRRAVMLGIGLNALASILLPVLGFGVGSALVGLFLFFLTFEFALVSTLPIMTELAPGARATMMAGTAAAHSAGRMLGALLGPLLFTGGLLINGLAAALFNLGALALLVSFLPQDERS